MGYDTQILFYHSRFTYTKIANPKFNIFFLVERPIFF